MNISITIKIQSKSYLECTLLVLAYFLGIKSRVTPTPPYSGSVHTQASIALPPDPAPQRPLRFLLTLNLALGFLLLRILQTLRLAQLRITDRQRKANQQHRQTNASNAKKTLDMAICDNDSVAVRGSDRVRQREREWVSKDGRSKRGVAGLESEFAGDDLLPEGAGDGVAEGAADVVGCEVDAGYDGDVWWNGQYTCL